MKPGTRFTVDSVGIYLLFSLFALASVAPFFLPSSVNGQRPWKGYAVLLVERSVPSARVVELFGKAGISGIIAEDTASVRFFTFGTEEAVRVREVSGRLDPEDPRYDEYMKRVSGYFHASDGDTQYDVYYIPRDDSGFKTWVEFYRILGASGIEWRLAGWNPAAHAVFLFFYITIVVTVVLSGGKLRSLFLLGGISWLPFLSGGDGLSYAAASLVFLAWVVAVRESSPFFFHRLYYPGDGEDFRKLARKSLYFFSVAASCILLFLLPPDNRNAYAAAAAAAAEVFLVVGAALLAAGKKKRRAHRLFIPVPILGRSFGRPESRPYPRFVPVLVLAALTLPLAVVSLTGKDSARVPVFRAAGGSGDFSWKTLELLWLRHNPESLPDISDYLAHRAFQEGFFYGRQYGFPAAGEALSLPVFSGSLAQKIDERQETVLVYDEEWFRKALSDTAPNGIERLLLIQERAGYAVRENITADVPAKSVIVKIFILYFFWWIPFAPAGKNLTSPTLYGMRSTLARRKRQEA